MKIFKYFVYLYNQLFKYKIKQEYRFSIANLVIVFFNNCQLSFITQSKYLFSRLITIVHTLYSQQCLDLYNNYKSINCKMLASQNLVRKESLKNSLILSHQNILKSPSKKVFSPVKPLYQFFYGKKEKQEYGKQKSYKSPEKFLVNPINFQNRQSTSTAASRSREKLLKIQHTKIKLQKVKEKFEKSCGDIKKGALLNNIKTPELKNNKSYCEDIKAIPFQQPNFITTQTFVEANLNKIDKKMVKQKKLRVLNINNTTQTFQIIKYIDQGSYGKVHLVQHLKTQSLYCLKTIAKSNINQHCAHQLVRQTIIQSYLNHPNIVNLYSFTADAQNIYLLLEAVPGQNLYKKLTKQKFSQKEIRKYIKEICVAVQYLHKNNIIHRDIKPENIIIHQNTVKLCDFGWAVHSPYLRKTQCGTPVYTSPEMIKQEYYDNKIDVWCIGVLTYQLLFGDIPFQIRNLNDLPKIVKDQIFFPKDANITDQARHFIKKCLEKNSSERYNIRQALEDDFLTTKIQTGFRNTYS